MNLRKLEAERLKREKEIKPIHQLALEKKQERRQRIIEKINEAALTKEEYNFQILQKERQKIVE